MDKTPIPNKQDLLKRLHSSVIYSKFDMKSGFLQLQIKEQDRYTKLLLQSLLIIINGMLCLLVFKMPFLNFKILLMIFSIFIFNSLLVCIDDVLVFSNSLEKHFVHLKSFSR